MLLTEWSSETAQGDFAGPNMEYLVNKTVALILSSAPGEPSADDLNVNEAGQACRRTPSGLMDCAGYR